jgi:ferrous iron transport protein B
MAREMNSRKFFWFAILFQNVFSYSFALMVYQLCGFVTGAVAFGPATVGALGIMGVILYLLLRPDPSKRSDRPGAPKEALA